MALIVGPLFVGGAALHPRLVASNPQRPVTQITSPLESDRVGVLSLSMMSKKTPASAWKRAGEFVSGAVGFGVTSQRAAHV